MEKTPQDYIAEVYGKFIDAHQTYHTPLPDDVKHWYAYVKDSGHSLICVLEQDLKDAFLYNEFHLYMTPLPVKFVLPRYYVLPNGFIVISGVSYDPNTGANLPKEFEEK